MSVQHEESVVAPEEVWYSGLRVQETRRLDWWDGLRIRNLREICLTDLAILCGFPSAILIAGVLGTAIFRWHDAPPVVAVAVIASLMVLRVWRTLPLYVKRLVALQRDAAAGEAIVCAGSTSELVLHKDARRGLQPSLLHRQRQKVLVVELLRHSGAILSINGEDVYEWSDMRRSATAPPPPRAGAVANFLRSFEGFDQAMGMRPLTGGEREELLARTPMSGVDTAIVVAVTLLAVVSWCHAYATASPTLATPIVSSVAAIWLIRRSRRFFLMYRRIMRDVRLGRVVVVQREENGERVGPVREYLLFSRFVWTENGVPANWRRITSWRGTYMMSPKK